MTAFIDPATGLISETWYRFLNSIWQRTGGATAPTNIDALTSQVDDLQAYTDLIAEPDAPDPIPAALLAYTMEDTAPAPDPAEAALLAMILGDVCAVVDPDQVALLAVEMDDTATQPENDPALVAMMVSDA
jgi:hypothetical protein